MLRDVKASGWVLLAAAACVVIALAFHFASDGVESSAIGLAVLFGIVGIGLASGDAERKRRVEIEQRASR